MAAPRKGGCTVLRLSHSGYYRWCQQRPSTRQREDAAIAAKVAAAHRASRGTYGVPRILVDLQESGTRTSKRRCARLMREQGLQGKKKHRRKPRTTDSRHAKPVAENIIALHPDPTGPNQCWLFMFTVQQMRPAGRTSKRGRGRFCPRPLFCEV